MKTYLLLSTLLLSICVSAQQPAAPKADAKTDAKTAAPKAEPKAPATTPAAAPQTAPPGTPNFCDQSFSGVSEDIDHNLVQISPPNTVYAVPYADVLDNHEKQKKVLEVLGREQNKGGPYTVTVTEVRNCDSAGNVRIQEGSAYVEGVTLAGSNRVAREALKQSDLIIKRYEDREKGGAKTGWNHKNAPKVQRDEMGQVIPPGQAKKQ